MGPFSTPISTAQVGPFCMLITTGHRKAEKLASFPHGESDREMLDQYVQAFGALLSSLRQASVSAPRCRQDFALRGRAKGQRIRAAQSRLLICPASVRGRTRTSWIESMTGMTGATSQTGLWRAADLWHAALRRPACGLIRTTHATHARRNSGMLARKPPSQPSPQAG